MLTIRKEQMQAFADARLADFERRLLAHLQPGLHRAGLAIGEAELAAQVRRGLAVGARFFTTERDLARYCEIVLLTLGGWDGDHPEDALEILASDSVPGDVRLRNFERWVAARSR